MYPSAHLAYRRKIELPVKCKRESVRKLVRLHSKSSGAVSVNAQLVVNYQRNDRNSCKSALRKHFFRFKRRTFVVSVVAFKLLGHFAQHCPGCRKLTGKDIPHLGDLAGCVSRRAVQSILAVELSG